MSKTEILNNCKNIRQLCAALNSGAINDENYDLSDLPLYSDKDPEDTSEIFSYDDQNLLIFRGESAGENWRLIPRE